MNLTIRILLPAIVGAILVGVGCSTTYHKEKADDENYEIIRQIEADVFGETNEFTIDTKYSGRDPQVFLPQELIDGRRATNVLRLNLDSALDTAFKNSRAYQRQKEDLYLAAVNLSNRRNAFSSIWSGRANPDIEREADGDVKLRSRSATSLGVSKRIFRTGGTITAGLANDVLRFVTGNPRRSLANTLSVSISQPLLRGFGKRSPIAENLIQAERNVIYEVREYDQFQRSFSVDVVNDYFDLLGLKNTIRNNYANYISRSNATVRAQARGGIERPINFQLALQAELNQKNSYIDSVTRYRTALDRFKDRLSIPLTSELFLEDGPFGELEKLGLAPLEFTTAEAYGLAVEKHLPTLSEIDRFEDSKRKILVAANQLKTGLDLEGSATLAWDKEEDYQKFDVDQVRANMGLALDLPLNRVSERNSYRSSLIDFERQARSLEQTLDSRRNVIELGFRTLKQRRQNYENNELGVKIAKERVLEMMIRVEQGNIDQQSLIDAENSLIREQNSRVTAIVDYQQARLQLLLDIGMLDTDTAQFWLPKDAAANQPAVLDDIESVRSAPITSPAKLFQENQP